MPYYLLALKHLLAWMTYVAYMLERPSTFCGSSSCQIASLQKMFILEHNYASRYVKIAKYFIKDPLSRQVTSLS